MPDLDRKIAQTGNLIRAAAALVALSVPTAALVELGNLPKTDAKLGLIILPATSIALILAIFVLGPRLTSLTRRRASILVLAAALCGGISAAAYGILADNMVVERNTFAGGKLIRSERDIKALRPTGELRDILRTHDYNYHRAIKLSDDPPYVLQLLRSQNRGARALILALMTLSQLLLVAAIVGGAWWLVETNEAEEGTKGGAAV